MTTLIVVCSNLYRTLLTCAVCATAVGLNTISLIRIQIGAVSGGRCPQTVQEALSQLRVLFPGLTTAQLGAMYKSQPQHTCGEPRPFVTGILQPGDTRLLTRAEVDALFSCKPPINLYQYIIERFSNNIVLKLTNNASVIIIIRLVLD